MNQKIVGAHSVRQEKMSHNVHHEGISLISLIITIIVIIILAAIVIFSGLNTPDSASFAGFTQQVDNVYQAVMNKYGELKTKHATAGHYRTDEQIYIEIAVAGDPEQYATMGTTKVNNYQSGTEIGSSTGIQNIQVLAAKDKDHSIGMTLPKVRESNTAWYVTKEGTVFNANGYVYDGKTYFSGSLYQEGELPANDGNNSGRAVKIYESISNDVKQVNSAPEDGVISYTVTFDTDGGSTVDSQRVADGGKATRPSDPSKTDQDFGGWYTDTNKTVAFDFDTEITDDITIYAKWNTPLTLGTEVTFKEEQFFVVGINMDDNTVDLLTKYCLDRTTGTRQLDASARSSNYGIAFASEKYWNGIVNDFNEISSSVAEEKDTVMQLVRTYGDAKDVTAKLMTQSRASSLGNLNGILHGNNYNEDSAPADGWLVWWLGSGNGSDSVYIKNGNPNIYYNGYNYDNTTPGVRPVITVPRNSIT